MCRSACWILTRMKADAWSHLPREVLVHSVGLAVLVLKGAGSGGGGGLLTALCRNASSVSWCHTGSYYSISSAVKRHPCGWKNFAPGFATSPPPPPAPLEARLFWDSLSVSALSATLKGSTSVVVLTEGYQISPWYSRRSSSAAQTPENLWTNLWTKLSDRGFPSSGTSMM